MKYLYIFLFILFLIPFYVLASWDSDGVPNNPLPLIDYGNANGVEVFYYEFPNSSGTFDICYFAFNINNDLKGLSCVR